MYPTLTLPTDGNDRVVPGNYAFMANKDMTFDGGTTNDPGDEDGTGNPATLFTVTGLILVALWARCSTDLAGATATLEVGVTGDTASLIAQTTATDIDDGDKWVDSTPSAVQPLPAMQLVSGDIIQTVATANITAGALAYELFWRPYSSDGNLVAA